MSKAGASINSHMGWGHTVDDRNPALPSGPSTMGIMVYSLLWVMQSLYHQPQL